MDTSLTLEQLAEKFKAWRATRSKREKIPENLLAQVAELKKIYKNSKIAHALRMNGGQVKALSPKNIRNFEFAELPPIFQKMSAISCDFSKACVIRGMRSLNPLLARSPNPLERSPHFYFQKIPLLQTER